MNTLTLARKTAKAAVLLPGLTRPRRKEDVVILLYHRLGGSSDREIDIPIDQFESQIRWLAEHERVSSLAGALGEESVGNVVVTFDDGYIDFYESALPILERHRVPAVLYLVTGSVDDSQPDSLSWRQVEDLVASGLVTIGAHTHHHVDLSVVPEKMAREEIQRSKDEIEDRLGIECRHFSYPWAVGSPAADHVVRRLFDTAALHAWRTNREGRVDRHRLGRVPVLRSDGPVFFRAKARGHLDTEGLLYRLFRRGPWRSR